MAGPPEAELLTRTPKTSRPARFAKNLISPCVDLNEPDIGIPLSAIIIGISLVIAGIPMLIYGRVQYQRRVMWDLKESVRIGVVQGMPAQGYALPAQYVQQVAFPGPSKPVARFCTNCAATLDGDAKFCPSCAAPRS